MRKLSSENSSAKPMMLLPAPRPAIGTASRATPLSPALAQILEEVQRELGFERAYGDVDHDPSSNEVEEVIARISERLGFELSSFERDQVLSQLERHQRPFGILQGLVDDPEVTDIVVTNFQRVCVQQGRKNLTTDITFATQAAYEAFIERLLNRAGATYSTKKPIADGMIGSFARLHAVHRSVCDNGPYLTIRLNRFSRVGLEDLLSCGLAPQPVLAFLRGIIRCGATMLIVGEVGTGKTTLARALASTIPHDEAILVIEDTPEIRLEHPHVRYVCTREANSEGTGRLAPSECIRAGMRMAMNRIIFGEMRDSEAAEAFIDVCASGHPGLSTIHARSAAEAVARLELFLGRAQRGVERRVLTEQIATAVQVVVHLGICSVTGRRRIREVVEIGPVADGVLRVREMFRYDATSEFPMWRVVNKVSAHRTELESSEDQVILSSLPSFLELSDSVLASEAWARNPSMSDSHKGAPV